MKRIATSICMLLLLFSLPVFLKAQTSYEYYQKGYEAFQKEDYITARDQCKKAIELTSSYKEAYWTLANAYYYLKDYRNAVASYSTTISYYSEYKDLSNLYYWRGQCKYELDEFDGAISDFNSAINYDSQKADIYWDRGRAWVIKKEYQKALDDYKKSLSFYQDDKSNAAILYSNICDCYLQLKKYDDAIANCTRSVENNPERGSPWWNRGLAYEAQKEYTEAIKDYTKALQYYSNSPKDLAILYSNIAGDQIELSQYDEAVQSAKKATEYNGSYGNGWWNLAAAYKNKEMYEESITTYSKTIDLFQNDFESLPTLYYWRARCKRDNKDYPGAISDYTKAIGYKPDYDDAYWGRAYTYEKMMKLNKAITEYKTTMAYYEDDNENKATLYSNIAKLQLSLGQYPASISSYNKALETKPKDESVYASIGNVYLQKKDYAAAIDNYTKTIERDTSKNPGAFTKSFRGYCYSKTNNKEKAIADLTACYEWDSKIDTCYYSAFCKYFIGDKQAAFSIVNKRLQNASEENKKYRYFDLAKLYALDNKETEVIKNLDAALKAGYDDYLNIYDDWELEAFRNKPLFKNMLVKYKVPRPE